MKTINSKIFRVIYKVWSLTSLIMFILYSQDFDISHFVAEQEASEANIESSMGRHFPTINGITYTNVESALK